MRLQCAVCSGYLKKNTSAQACFSLVGVRTNKGFPVVARAQPAISTERMPATPPETVNVNAEDLDLEPGTIAPRGVPPNFRLEPEEGFPGLDEYLRMILTASVYDVAIETALDPAPRLSDRLGSTVLLKREDTQQVFSFKLRGAFNLMASLTPEELGRGVITSSAGNHAQGVALAAQKLGCSAVIAMPVTTPGIKVSAVRQLGAQVKLIGDTYDACQTWAKSKGEEEGRIYIPPFDEPHVIAGQGTVAMELLRQQPGKLDAVFVPVGGGGLLAGIAAYIKAVRPEILVFGVEPAGANAMAQSLSRSDGRRCVLRRVDAFADGVAVRTPGEETLRVCRALCDGIVTVRTDQICAAIKDVFEETRSILEPAGAVSLAGAKAWLAHKEHLDTKFVVTAVTSGANVNFDRLRTVVELADLGDREEVLLATLIPEVPGAFKSLVSTVLNVVPQDKGALVTGDVQFTEFKYRYHPGRDAAVFYSLGCRARDLSKLKAQLQVRFPGKTLDLSSSELATAHLRYLVGGKAQVPFEKLVHFEFPERPGALMDFLGIMTPRFNVTLFHYRNQGSRQAEILIGLQIPPMEEAAFVQAADRLTESGYSYRPVHGDDSDEAFRIFMC